MESDALTPAIAVISGSQEKQTEKVIRSRLKMPESIWKEIHHEADKREIAVEEYLQVLHNSRGESAKEKEIEELKKMLGAASQTILTYRKIMQDHGINVNNLDGI